VTVIGYASNKGELSSRSSFGLGLEISNIVANVSNRSVLTKDCISHDEAVTPTIDISHQKKDCEGKKHVRHHSEMIMPLQERRIEANTVEKTEEEAEKGEEINEMMGLLESLCAKVGKMKERKTSKEQRAYEELLARMKETFTNFQTSS
jgi:hypothetical protein